MSIQTIDLLREFVANAARRLGNGLDYLDWPNGNKAAPPSELNGLLNFHYFLANNEPPFHCYSESSISDRDGRVDLICCNGPIALAIEAKSMGPINARSEDILKDLNRLREYAPAYSKPNTPFAPTDWWAQASERWGLVLITSFRGEEVKKAWESEDLTEAYNLLQTYPSPADRPKDRSSGMMQLIGLSEMTRFSGRITHKAKWGEAETGWLLCGAVQL